MNIWVILAVTAHYQCIVFILLIDALGAQFPVDVVNEGDGDNFFCHYKYQNYIKL